MQSGTSASLSILLCLCASKSEFRYTLPGLLGVLIEGKRRQLVPALRPLLDTLAADARFWIDDRLRDYVLHSVGETP